MSRGDVNLKRELRQKIAELKELQKALESTSGEDTAGNGGGLQPSAQALDSVAEDVFDELVGQLSLSVAFDFHRMVKLGLVCPCSGDDSDHVYGPCQLHMH